MLTLSFGFKKPESGDRGDPLFTALEDNVQQLNDHNHDGANSSQLNSSAILPVSAALVSANWVLVADGIYKQTVTLPAAIPYDEAVFTCKLANGDIFYPTIEKVSSTQYDIFINDNSQDVTVLYM